MTVSLIFSLIIIALCSIGVSDLSLVSSFISGFNFQTLLLHGMLAFILFAGGVSINLSDLLTQKGAIFVLSTLGVVLSVVIVACLFWLPLSWMGINIPFVIALLIGAIISPTDAVAVLGILREVGVAKNLETKVVGGSLFNDGVGVVVFLAVSSLAFGKNISVPQGVYSLCVETLGGIVLGLLLGGLSYKMLKAVDEYVVEILITLALASGGYALAEILHVSAPICVVVAGLIIGNQGRTFAMSEQTKQHLDTFWELVDELLNAMLFVLFGLEIVTLSFNSAFIFAGVFAIIAVQISRFVSVGLSIAVMKRWRSFSPHAVKILYWGGLKGGISVALALSVPECGFNNLLIIATYIVVLFSVLIQGSTLPILLSVWRKKAAA